MPITDSEDFFAEECWVLHGVCFGNSMWVWHERHISIGDLGSVNFDWEKAWDDRGLIGWRHTHPGSNFDYPSSVDDRTMMSWVRATGRSMVCGVTCGRSTKYYLYTRASNGAEHIKLDWKRLPLVGIAVAEIQR